MNTKHLISIIVLSFAITPLYAQEKAAVRAATKAPEMIYKVERQVARGLRISEGVPVRPPYRANPVSVADIQESLRLVESPATAQPTRAKKRTTPKASATPKESNPTPPPERYVSPLRDFLREDWEMPELPQRPTQCGFSSCWGDLNESVGTGVDPLRAAAIEFGMPAQISREILQMQARGLGIPAENIEHASRSELWLLISLYETMAKSGEIVSRYDEFAQSAGEKKSSLAVAQWARKQPDFVKENYVYEEYYEPFNEAVTQLRILIINDNKRYLEPLLDMAVQDSRIKVDVVDSVVAAFPALKTKRSKYDVVLTDYYTHAGNALELSMWAYKNGIKTPIVFFSNAEGSASYLYSYNIAGRIGLKQPARSVVNYLSNLVATGKAYPNR